VSQDAVTGPLLKRIRTAPGYRFEYGTTAFAKAVPAERSKS
jgi:hypothetical protein